MEQQFIQQLFQRNWKTNITFPDKHLTERFIDELFNFLFGSYEKKFDSADKLSIAYTELKHSFSTIVSELIEEEATVKQHTESFFNKPSSDL